MSISDEECLKIIKESNFIHESECSYVADKIVEILSFGPAVSVGSSHSTFITMLDNFDNVIFRVDYTITQGLGHSFILLKNGGRFSLYQSFINGYTLYNWINMIPSKFMPDMLFSPGHHYSHHGIVKFINMLKYDLNPAELNNQTLVAIFHRMFGGNPAFIKRLLMALSMGLGKYDSTWHWRIYHIRQIVPPEKAASQSNADQLRGLNDLGIIR